MCLCCLSFWCKISWYESAIDEGVIVGSLNAALKGKPLDENEYLVEKRSNVPNKDDAGRDKRRLVYEEFKRYGQWKKENNRYDLGGRL